MTRWSAFSLVKKRIDIENNQRRTQNSIRSFINIFEKFNIQLLIRFMMSPLATFRPSTTPRTAVNERRLRPDDFICFSLKFIDIENDIEGNQSNAKFMRKTSKKVYVRLFWGLITIE